MAVTDYLKLLEGYPGLAQQLRAIDAAGGLNQAQLSGTRQRALAQFGQIPDNLDSASTGAVNADVNQATRDLAGQLTQGGVSTTAQLQRAYDAQRNQGIAALAEHGLARSGGTGQVIRESLGNYQRGLFGANQTLQDALANAYQGFLGQQTTLRGQQTDAVNSAQTGLNAQINSGMIGGGTGSTGAGNTTGLGQRYVPPNYAHATAAAPHAGIVYPGGARTATAKPPQIPAAPSGGLSRSLRFE